MSNRPWSTPDAKWCYTHGQDKDTCTECRSLVMSKPDKIELTEETLKEWRSLGPGYVKQLIDALRATRQELATIQAAHLMDGAETVARNKRIAELEQQLDAI